MLALSEDFLGFLSCLHWDSFGFVGFLQFDHQCWIDFNCRF